MLLLALLLITALLVVDSADFPYTVYTKEYSLYTRTGFYFLATNGNW